MIPFLVEVTESAKGSVNLIPLFCRSKEVETAKKINKIKIISNKGASSNRLDRILNVECEKWTLMTELLAGFYRNALYHSRHVQLQEERIEFFLIDIDGRA